ncbi:hypothetical protein ACFFGV_00190 [Pontibacillus salicampi]|uniref:Uncharacterized protein n=1 Tax=Pontibacillus salicampi TaxID=1449801 RepID=A0ABV6LI28_9BACI
MGRKREANAPQRKEELSLFQRVVQQEETLAEYKRMLDQVKSKFDDYQIDWYTYNQQVKILPIKWKQYAERQHVNELEQRILSAMGTYKEKEASLEGKLKQKERTIVQLQQTLERNQRQYSVLQHQKQRAIHRLEKQLNQKEKQFTFLQQSIRKAEIAYEQLYNAYNQKSIPVPNVKAKILLVPPFHRSRKVLKGLDAWWERSQSFIEESRRFQQWLVEQNIMLMKHRTSPSLLPDIDCVEKDVRSLAELKEQIDVLKNSQTGRETYMWNIWKSEQQEEYQKKIDRIEETIQSLEKHLMEYKETMEEWNQSKTTASLAEQENFQKHVEELSEMLNVYQQKEEQYHQEMEEMTEQLKALQQTEDTLEDTEKHYQEQLQQYQLELKNSQETNEQLQEELAAKEEQSEAFQEKITELEQELRMHQAKEGRAEGELQRLQNHIKRYEATKKEDNRKIDSLKQKIGELKQKKNDKDFYGSSKGRELNFEELKTLQYPKSPTSQQTTVFNPYRYSHGGKGDNKK